MGTDSGPEAAFLFKAVQGKFGFGYQEGSSAILDGDTVTLYLKMCVFSF